MNPHSYQYTGNSVASGYQEEKKRKVVLFDRCYECDEMRPMVELEQYTLGNGFKRLRCKKSCIEE
jgi:hypothetical protein